MSLVLFYGIIISFIRIFLNLFNHFKTTVWDFYLLLGLLVYGIFGYLSLELIRLLVLIIYWLKVLLFWRVFSLRDLLFIIILCLFIGLIYDCIITIKSIILKLLLLSKRFCLIWLLGIFICQIWLILKYLFI